MATGSSVHRNIRAKISEVQNNASTYETQLTECEGKITSLLNEREQCLVELTDIYSPSESHAQAIQTTFAEAQNIAKGIFAEKQKRRQELEELMQDSQDKTTRLQKQVDDLTSNLNQKAEERDKIKKEVTAELHSNPQYAALDTQAQEANSKLLQYKRRIDEVEQESKQKIPAFEQNRLFMYLIRKGYTTDSGSGIIASLDSWIAKKINFAEQKKNYDFLKAMPELMRTEVAERQEALDKVVQEMQKYEADTEKKHGLPQVLEEGGKLDVAKKKIIEQIQTYDSQYRGYSQERAEMDGKKDPYHIEIDRKVKELLEHESIQQLKAQARKTPSPDDDRIVDRMEKIDSSVEELKDEAKEIRKNRDAEAERLNGLAEIERSFRSRNYDSSNSRFKSGFDIDSLLVGYIAGNVSSGQIVRDLQTHHYREEPEYHASSNYSSDYSSRSSDSGFGGGGGGSISMGSGFGGGGGGSTSAGSGW